MSPFLLRTFGVGLMAIPFGVGAQTGLPKQSPFAPAGGAQSAVGAANETLEFAGVSSIGRKTDLIIHDKNSKRKHWIGIGETVDGISVVRYDAANEQATVRVNGAEKVLILRKPTRAAGSPAPVAAVPGGFNVPPPVAVQPPADPVQFVQKILPAPPPDAAPPAVAPTPAAPQTPAAQAKAETEARMLVSDLLEIGMAQRKTYEEAQRKSAGGGTEQPPPASQPPAPAPGAAQPASPTPPTNE